MGARDKMQFNQLRFDSDGRMDVKRKGRKSFFYSMFCSSNGGGKPGECSLALDVRMCQLSLSRISGSGGGGRGRRRQ